MKCILAFVVVCIALTYAENPENVEERIPNIGEIITELIEGKRDELKAKGYNNFQFKDFELPIDSDALGIKAQLKASGTIRGGLDFLVDKFVGLLFTYKFDFVWPGEIDIIIEPYDLQGYINLIQVFGTGTLHANLKELGISGKVNFSPIPNLPNELYIRAITPKVRLGNEQDKKWFSLTGWMNDPVVSEIISVLVRRNFQDLLAEYEKEIGDILGATVVDLMKDIHISVPTGRHLY